MPSLFEQKQDLAAQTQRTKELNAELEQALAQAQQVKEELEEALRLIGADPHIADGIQLAYEMGRLDVLSFILAGFGLFLGIVALFGFWLIRRESRTVAKESADSFMEEMPDRVKKYLEQITPDIVKDIASPLVKQSQEELERQNKENWSRIREYSKKTDTEALFNSISGKEK